ncbi:MAG: hypothetical protein WAW80_00145 [Candidatus Saccharimonadales bacterium]
MNHHDTINTAEFNKLLGGETSVDDEQGLMRNTLEQLDGKIDTFRHDNDLHLFVHGVAKSLGVEIADIDNIDLDEKTYKSAIHSMLDTRKGKSREEAAEMEYDSDALEILERLKHEYLMVGDSTPEDPECDMGLAHGGAADTIWRRLKYLSELVDAEKINTNTFGALASERSVNDAERERAKRSGYSKRGEPAITEFDLARNAASDIFDIDDEEWMYINGNDPTIPEQHRYQSSYKIAYAAKDGKHVFVLSAPMIDENRQHPDGKRRNRSNTADTMAMVARMLHDVKSDPKIIASTDAIFQFQRPDGESRLAPLGVKYEQVGFSREWANMPDFTPRYYAQELWSLINQTYKARDYLRNQYNITD